MEAEHLTAKQFAEQVGISAGTISNIMGGRNKPSLDVMQAVLNRFRTINSDWLILDIGSMYRINGDGPQQTLFDIKPNDSDQPAATVPQSASSTPATVAPTVTPIEKKVAKIMVYYTDGTYEER